MQFSNFLNCKVTLNKPVFVFFFFVCVCVCVCVCVFVIILTNYRKVDKPIKFSNTRFEVLFD